jgi:hypothetical protein
VCPKRAREAEPRYEHPHCSPISVVLFRMSEQEGSMQTHCNALLDARVHDARHLRRPEGDCVLSFVLSCHDQEAEVLVLVHDHAGPIS